MKLKRVISTLLLGIYLLSSCGAMLSVILCHCTRSAHYIAEHEHHTHCCHTPIQGEGIKMVSDCGCHHDHSTEIDLYDYDKIYFIALQPAVYMLPQAAQSIEEPQSDIDNHYFHRRKIPLPRSFVVTLNTLRAPPVMA